MADPDAEVSIDMTSLNENKTKDDDINAVVPKQVRSTPAQLSQSNGGKMKSSCNTVPKFDMNSGFSYQCFLCR